MKRIVLMVVCLVALTGCGAWDRTVAQLGGVAESCHDGVAYLQFASGASVKYNQNGSVALCK